MHRPFRLERGDTIGVVAPASPVPPDELARGRAVLEERGYRVRVGANVLAVAPHCSYLAGTDQQRAADINAMFADPDVDAIFCARGGYGCMRLFDLLDWGTIAANPKLFLGYSDITSLHTAFAHLGWATVHGTMVSSLWKLGAERLAQFWQLLESGDPPGVLAPPVQTIVPGIVEGRLTGGNLCLLAQACGSRFAPALEDRIVLLEDVGDPVYRADRDLTQLLNAGHFDRAAGFVLGDLTGWEKHEDPEPRNTPRALWTEFFTRLGKPAIAGFPFGHVGEPLALPLGVAARLDAGAGILTILEAAVRERPRRLDTQD